MLCPNPLTLWPLNPNPLTLTHWPLNLNPLTVTPHFCYFDCLLTVFDFFDCFWRLVHRWYSLGRPVTIGTPMVLNDLTIGTVYHSSKTIKRQSSSKKWPLVYQSSHVYTESTEYTKPHKRRYLARPPSHVPGQWPQPVARGQGWLCVYMDVYASGSRSLPRAATLSSTYWWYLMMSINDRHQIFHRYHN